MRCCSVPLHQLEPSPSRSKPDSWDSFAQEEARQLGQQIQDLEDSFDSEQRLSLMQQLAAQTQAPKRPKP